MKQSSLKYSLFIILAAIFTLSACSQDTVNRTEKKEYTFETAKDKGDIIERNGNKFFINCYKFNGICNVI
ncbi:hypothetical protein BAMA_18385 [Bacillus manliponensis]|uniref:Lipoprotein n=1 Tax=Bacillus manliponensis TaxID=574376 RepID=A0A073K4C9_9BACI|nr:hypothetical protein [Bacillus manliponensis]KEK17133.1 hypothetical protein BAMA_18385 [Bacillus manliponensis]